MKYCRRTRGPRKSYHAQHVNLPGLEFVASAIATIMQLPSSSKDHPIPYKLSVYVLLLFFYASAAKPVLSRRYGGAAHFSGGVATISASLAVVLLLCVALKAEFRWMPYLCCIFPTFSVLYNPAVQIAGLSRNGL
ncbi:hypothetical protein MRB53_032555 [Persea americana]|uniref:Uncharacterized protein n=1 Tax=Persea americana TaxID=3435 RepID=A0ACC2KSK2_PERAE|nr:hypothetical protein MRB53_032555 [Persea americana]